MNVYVLSNESWVDEVACVRVHAFLACENWISYCSPELVHSKEADSISQSVSNIPDKKRYYQTRTNLKGQRKPRVADSML